MSLPSDVPLLACPDVAIRSMDDGAVLVDMRSGACFELNRVGLEIWELVIAGATPLAVREALGQRYQVSEDVLAADVDQLLESLVQQKLIAPGGARQGVSR